MDVIIVLGAAVWAGGKPSPSLRRRILHGIKLYRQGISDILILTGGVGKYPPSEAEAMGRLAREHGIAEDRIILEETAASTLDSAVACSGIIRENGWSTALVVTDQYHLFRSVFLFRKFGVQALGSGPQSDRSNMGRWRWWYMHVREFFALLWSLLGMYVIPRLSGSAFRVQG